jgi:hypothetical protein
MQHRIRTTQDKLQQWAIINSRRNSEQYEKRKKGEVFKLNSLNGGPAQAQAAGHAAAAAAVAA